MINASVAAAQTWGLLGKSDELLKTITECRRGEAEFQQGSWQARGCLTSLSSSTDFLPDAPAHAETDVLFSLLLHGELLLIDPTQGI